MSSTDLPAGAATDPDVARPWVEAVVQRAALERGWPSDALEAAMASIEAAYQEADSASWWGADADTWWAALTRETQSASWSTQPGADGLARTWEAAAGWASDVQAQQEAEIVSGQVSGAAEGAASDVVVVATAANTAAKSPATWGLAAIAAVVVVVVLVVKR